MTNHPELKACPWCKDGGHIRHHLGKKKYCKLHDATSQDYLIYCGNNFETAHARFTGSDEQDAFRRWNARPSPIIPEDAFTIAELREILGIKNKADESVIEHVKEIIRINKRLFADWQKKFFEETDAKNAVQPVTDDALREKK